MYRKLLCCLLTVVMVFVSGGSRLILPVEADTLSAEKNVPTEASATKRDFTDSEVLVAMTHEESLKFTKYTASDFAEIGCASVKDLSSATAEKVQQVLRGEKLAEDSVGAAFMNENINVDTFHTILSLKLSEPGKENVLRAVALLNQREDVYIAEPNYILQLYSAPATDFLATATPNYNWGAEKIGLADAWEIETGSTSVLVGVVDSGIDASHPELSGIVENEANGLSKNFSIDGRSALTDPNGHGTHVAGIIAAKHNNDGLNLNGVCASVKLVSLRVADQNGNFEMSELGAALSYAEANDIPILNLSLETSDIYVPAILYLTEINYTGLIVSCAGNGGDVDNFLDEYDGELPGYWEERAIITVGASTSTDARASYSNYSAEKVDLFAPGASILSCYPQPKCTNYMCPESGHVAFGYHVKDGTSMAAPYVTGVAALILAHNPNLTPQQIKDTILMGVQNIPAFENICTTGGRLDAYAALQRPLLHTADADSYAWEDETCHSVSCTKCNFSWTDIHRGVGGSMFCYYCGGRMLSK